MSSCGSSSTSARAALLVALTAATWALARPPEGTASPPALRRMLSNRVARDGGVTVDAGLVARDGGPGVDGGLAPRDGGPGVDGGLAPRDGGRTADAGLAKPLERAAVDGGSVDAGVRLLAAPAPSTHHVAPDAGASLSSPPLPTPAPPLAPAAAPALTIPERPAQQGPRVVILPLTNLSGRAVALGELRAQAEGALSAAMVSIVPPADVDQFLERHRFRYTAGVGGALAEAAAQELGATAIAVVTVELVENGPRFGAGIRLVSAGETPRILWADAVSFAGDQEPGLFDLGVLREAAAVQRRVFNQLAGRAAAYLAGTPTRPGCEQEGRFAPRAQFVSRSFPAGRPLRVAVMPLVNVTRLRHAGDLVTLQLIRSLASIEGVEVLEPGLLREQLLRFRITVEGGISLDTARLVSELVDAQLLIAGTTGRYEEFARGAPAVQFTAYALARDESEIVWQASLSSRGDDAVFFFDVGWVATAQQLTCRMAVTALQPFHSSGQPPVR